jgi:hypothetical protein
MDSMETVLSIPELAESIFLLLPPKDLLLSARRVSKAWQNLITHSPILQRALCFRPGSRRRLDKLIHGTKQARSSLINPFANIISLAQPCSPAFAYRDASWRHMLVTQAPVPMYLYQHSPAFGDVDRLFLSEVRDPTDPRFTGQSLESLTFGDIERLAYGRKAHVVVFCYGMVVWTKAAFECAIDKKARV